jgi:hypothetical protein
MRIKIGLAACLILAIAAAGGYWLWDQYGPSRQREDAARAKLAFESIAQRLPKGRPISPRKPFDADSKKRWQDQDERIAELAAGRADMLKALHERTRRFFVESYGAGSSRGFTIDPIAFMLDSSYGNGGESQPGAPADFPLSPSEKANQVQPDDEFHSLNRASLYGFMAPTGFGYMKDRDHVSGFESHGFRHWLAPEKGERWRVDHIQLVGILTHDPPLVYLTDKMPSMDQIRQGKTRGLDYFEEIALPKLCDGEDLYIVQKNDTIRMLGAVRATKTCQKCHDAEIGDLLGAFSYTLRPIPTKAERNEWVPPVPPE